MEVGINEKVGVGSYDVEVRGSSGSELDEGVVMASKEIASSSVTVVGSSGGEGEVVYEGGSFCETTERRERRADDAIRAAILSSSHRR